MKSKLKRWLLLLHRWLGIGMCVPIALWFASGIVMMYVEYPELTENERLAMLPPLALESVRLDAGAAVAALGVETRDIASLELTTVLGRPAYQLERADGRIRTVFADDGTVLSGLSAHRAEAAARHSGFAAGATPRYAATLEMDQWTVSTPLAPFRPLHKIELDDAAGTVLYVSDVTGQVVRDTNARERLWNWVGSTIHWIYPWRLRRNVDLWANVIIVLSLAGLISIVTGAIVGWWRLRLKRPYRRGVTPYCGMLKWHHLLGLGTVLFLLTFMFSGLMSMAPWGVFDNATSAAPAIARYRGGPFGDPATYPAARTHPGEAPLKELEWIRVAGEPYLVASHGDTSRAVIGAAGLLSRKEVRALIDRAVPALLPGAALLGSEVIATHDDYYYSHHDRYRPLPVLRVKLADPEQSWFHLNLATGQVVNRLTHTDRVARWLYNGLHSLDFALLFQRRPLWDVVVIGLCVLGPVFSITCVCVGWRRLHR